MFPKQNTIIFLQAQFDISKSSIVAIAKRFEMLDENFLEELEEQWKQFLLHFASVSEDTYLEHVKLESPEFWKLYLDQKDPDYVIQSNLRMVLEKALALAIGSSSVERIFSIHSALHTKQRNRLTLKHRNSMLLIRSNMELDFDNFPSEEVAEMWYEDGHLRADDPIVPVRKTSPKKSKKKTSLQTTLEEKNSKEKSKLFSKTP